jgi:hypothetical protein
MLPERYETHRIYGPAATRAWNTPGKVVRNPDGVGCYYWRNGDVLYEIEPTNAFIGGGFTAHPVITGEAEQVRFCKLGWFRGYQTP